MAFWEYEYFIDEVRETIKREEEHNKEQEKSYSSNKMYRDAQRQMSKMPSAAHTPNMSMPHMPKM